MAARDELSKAQETVLKEMYGKRLLQEYMDALSSRDSFKTTFDCVKKGHKKEVTYPVGSTSTKINHILMLFEFRFFLKTYEACPTPFGLMMNDINAYHPLQPRVLRIHGAGTSCVDVSSMGAQKGLLGGSCRSLAIWMSEIMHCQPVTCM